MGSERVGGGGGEGGGWGEGCLIWMDLTGINWGSLDDVQNGMEGPWPPYPGLSSSDGNSTESQGAQETYWVYPIRSLIQPGWRRVR